MRDIAALIAAFLAMFAMCAVGTVVLLAAFFWVILPITGEQHDRQGGEVIAAFLIGFIVTVPIWTVLIITYFDRRDGIR